MKRSTTRFLLVLLMLSLCFLCTACGGGSGSAESNVVSDPNEGLGDKIPANSEDTASEFRMYEGLWEGDTENLFDDIFIAFDADGNWQLYSSDGMTDEGYLLYDEDQDATYIYSYQAGMIDGGQVELYDGVLYITTVGYFNHCASEDDPWNFDLYHRAISEFEGVWYYDGDLSAPMYIVIDGYGNWSYYERAYGEAEGAEMDWGTFSYSADESGVYYADSAIYDGLQFRMYDLDEGVLLWNEDTYYRMEDGGYSDNGSYYSWNAELFQRNVSELEGVWYYEDDYSAMMNGEDYLPMAYIVIDAYGNWSYYECAEGEAEGAEMDWGTFSYSTDEPSTYYADSAIYDGLSYRVYDFDNDILLWNDYAIYRMW